MPFSRNIPTAHNPEEMACDKNGNPIDQKLKLMMCGGFGFNWVTCFHCGCKKARATKLCSCCGNGPVCRDCYQTAPEKWKPYEVCRVCEDFLSKQPCKLPPDECADTKKDFPCIRLDHRQHTPLRAAVDKDDDKPPVVIAKKVKGEDDD